MICLFTMTKSIGTLVALIVLATTASYSQSNQNLDEELRTRLKSESFNDALLLQSTFRYSFDDDEFQGGRTFQVQQGRVDITGDLNGGYFYRLHVNMITEPNLLDAYVGYKLNDQLILTFGRQKPQQSSDFIPGPQSTDFMARARILNP